MTDHTWICGACGGQGQHLTTCPRGRGDAHRYLSALAAAIKKKVEDAATGRDESKGAWVDYYAGMQDAYREVLAFVQYELDQTRGLGGKA